MTPPDADPRPARARLFVALELPTDARAELGGWARQAFEGEESLRLTAVESLHVTLVFLGSRDEQLVGGVVAATRAAADGLPAPMLVPRALVALPPRHPRVLALDLDDRDGRVQALQAAVESALAADGLHVPEKRPFRPHLTLARVRRGGRAPSGRFPDPLRESLAASEVVVYRSDLRPDGARYTPLDRVALP